MLQLSAEGLIYTLYIHIYIMKYIIAKHSISSTPVLTTETHYKELESKLLLVNESIQILFTSEHLETLLLQFNYKTLDILL